MGLARAEHLRRTTIVGSRKMVVYDNRSIEPVRVFDAGVTLPDPETFSEYRLSYRTGDLVSPRVDVIESLFLELNDFCQAIRTGTSPCSTPALGLDVLRAVEAAERSLANGGALTEVEAALVSLSSSFRVRGGDLLPGDSSGPSYEGCGLRPSDTSCMLRDFAYKALGRLGHLLRTAEAFRGFVEPTSF